ncbi:GW dipeptide domain-containing protein [Oenococcus oeni]
MFLKKGKKKLYKSGKNWVAALLLSASVLSFYSADLNQQTASAATSSQTKAVSYDKITNKQTVNYSAYVNENNRNDGLYSAPALTSAASMTSTGSAKSLNGHLVTVSEIDTTKRASTGLSYQYARITDNNKSYWVDARALNDSAQITSTQTVNFQAYINGDTRNDGLYSAPALTTSSSLTPLAYSKSLNKKSVMVSEIDTTKRASTGLSYQYAKITYNGKTYWVDARALNNVTYQGTITVEYEDENGNQIAAPTMITKNIYSEYTTSPEIISGYTVNLSKTQGITDGMTFATQTVIYVYDKNAAATTDLIGGQGQGTDSNRWVVGTDVQPGWYEITPINLGTNDWIGLDAATNGIINDNDFYADLGDGNGELSSYRAYLTTGQVLEMQDTNLSRTSGQGLHLEALSSRSSTTAISSGTLGAGVYEVGVDIQPGTYAITDLLGDGYLSTKDGNVNLDLGTDYGDTSTATITLKTGEMLTSNLDKLTISQK